MQEESRPSRRSRWIGRIVALLALLALGGLAWYLTHRPAAGGAPPGASSGGPPGPGGPGGMAAGRGGPATTVGIARAERADIPIVIEALGTVTPSATVTVRPQVSGVLTEVRFKEGQMVKAGEVLAVIDPRPLELALMQAQGQRQRDEAQLQLARLTLERYQTLLQQDSIARQDVDTQAAAVKQLEGTVLSNRAAEGTARLNLGYTRITAPVSGRVGLRVVDVGNVVSSGDANGIVVITQLAPIDVQFAVPQDRVPDIERRTAQGATLPVTALDRSRATTLDEGRFSTLNNEIDTTTGTVQAKARFANAGRTLFPNQFVNVRLQLDTLRDAVVIPVAALRHSNDGDFVYVLNDDRTVSQRMVQRGQATNDRVQITRGLAVGEPVVTEGADRLKDGARVQVPGDRPARGASAPAGGASAPGRGASAPRRAASAPVAR
ncbi:MdtA/MuxA family multidrug efflux RND transporter periplasmic adaptor subunit [Aquincola tertiaricarbonis]|uniref:MdtA/MuxA family multidrug efflux RND transporter periplasmic adaptor subunit n=1 Tax=Aquincola tertiaricarbonis TaxID=391953 RepID=UPI000614D0F2|nr:MdtA/MuxA family multidrug efflux RND transporter periplasmic adaptor subunit [Aquincola tertiaricarbonis]